MPLQQYSVPGRNVYSTVEALTKAAVPDSILDGINEASLVGVLHQLSFVAKFSEQLFSNIYAESNAIFQKIKSCSSRIERIEKLIPEAEHKLERIPALAMYEAPGRRIEMREEEQSSLISESNRPWLVQALVARTKPPPAFEDLDGYHDPNEPSAMTKYTDPSFFFQQWLELQLRAQEDGLKEKRGKKKKKKKGKKAIRMRREVASVQVKKYSAMGKDFGETTMVDAINVRASVRIQPKIVEEKYTAICDFNGDQESGELNNIKIGDKLVVLEKSDANWWECRTAGNETGHIPRNYIQRADIGMMKTDAVQSKAKPNTNASVIAAPPPSDMDALLGLPPPMESTPIEQPSATPETPAITNTAEVAPVAPPPPSLTTAIPAAVPDAPPPPISTTAVPPPPPPSIGFPPPFSNTGAAPPSPPPPIGGPMPPMPPAIGTAPPPPPPPPIGSGPPPPPNSIGIPPPPPSIKLTAPPVPPAIPPAPDRSNLLASIRGGAQLKKAAPAPSGGSDARGNLLASIRDGANLKKVTQSRPADARSNLLTSIRGGISLKKASERKLAEKAEPEQGGGTVSDILKRTMMIRAAAAVEFTDSETDSDEEEWDD